MWLNFIYESLPFQQHQGKSAPPPPQKKKKKKTNIWGMF
jgi:hypothetical protein